MNFPVYGNQNQDAEAIPHLGLREDNASLFIF